MLLAHPPRPSTARRTGATIAALVLGLSLPLASPARAQDRPDIQPLPAHLEQIRAAEAMQMYGSPDIRPLEERNTALITMGDSEISGEGVGNYEPGTHEDGNWCDRSLDQAVWKLTIESDVRYNVACSGADPVNMEYGGPSQWDELNQGDSLAIHARNTHLKLIWVVAGANGPGSIEFGPVASDCALRRVFFMGTCWPTYTDQWGARVEVTRTNVESALQSIRQTMTDAGYLNSDYDLVLQSYPSPAGPDVEDNPNFPGWYSGGCLLYLADMAFARNKAVPMFERALRAAAHNTGTRYLDNSRLFAGLEPCSDFRAVRGLTIEWGIWDENAARQSFHPNSHGHVMFAECMDQFYASGLPEATCLDNTSTHHGTLYEGLIEFSDLVNEATGGCLDAKGYDSRNRTALQSYGCHGGRNQGFWYDPVGQAIHVELSHDRCLDIEGGPVVTNKNVNLFDCRPQNNQRWVFDGPYVHPSTNAGLCLGLNTASPPRLQTQNCSGSARQRWSVQGRDYANPVGYGHSDFIGSKVY